MPHDPPARSPARPDRARAGRVDPCVRTAGATPRPRASPRWWRRLVAGPPPGVPAGPAPRRRPVGTQATPAEEEPDGRGPDRRGGHRHRRHAVTAVGVRRPPAVPGRRAAAVDATRRQPSGAPAGSHRRRPAGGPRPSVAPLVPAGCGDRARPPARRPPPEAHGGRRTPRRPPPRPPVAVRLPSAGARARAVAPPAADAPAPPPTGPRPRRGHPARCMPEVRAWSAAATATHRLTLKPAARGPRRGAGHADRPRGEVHVRMAAGSEARQALLEGAPELRRVLELSRRHATPGSSSATSRGHHHRLRASPPPPPTSAGTRAAATAARPGRATPATTTSPAGTRSGTTARDGATGGASHAPSRPGRAPRSAGVDVTM